MRKFVLILFIFLWQSSKIFSQQSNITAEFYVKFNSSDQYSISKVESFVNAHVCDAKTKLLEITQPFKSKNIGNFSTFFRLKFSTENPFVLQQKIEKVDGVLRVEKVIQYQFHHMPNDPKYAYTDTMWHLYKINAAGAWDLSRGSDSVVIAVVDDNFEITHPDLQANIYTNPLEIADDGLDNDSNGIIDDDKGADVSAGLGNPYTTDVNFAHGTKVAGCVSAKTNNGIGIAGLGYACKILPVKCTNNFTTVTHGLEGMFYAASMPDVQVVNTSWGDETYSQTMQDIIDSAMFHKNNKIVFVSSAGNSNDTNATYPAACNHVLAVSATDKFDNKLSQAKYGSWVDIAAPGISIYTTKINGKYGRYSETGNLITGTSFSSPIVAGAVGLMFAINENLTFSEIVHCLKSTSDATNPVDPFCQCPVGGRLNIAAAMQCICSSNVCLLSEKELAIDNNDGVFIFNENTLKFNSNLSNENQHLYLFNGIGQIVLEQKIESNQSIDLSKYSTGIYIAKVSLNSKAFTKKIVIE
jgi:subtilisin family serine protease